MSKLFQLPKEITLGTALSVSSPGLLIHSLSLSISVSICLSLSAREQSDCREWVHAL